MIFVFLCVLIIGVKTVVTNDYGNRDIQDDVERLQRHLKQSGGNNFRDYLEKSSVNDWKNYQINIGITGQSGVGKSTFINTIRGLRANDSQAAPVGVGETTKTTQSYPDKNNANLVYWDLPGCGTSNFPRDTYLKTVDFDKYDHLIIITSTRFTENDRWLVTQAKERRKPFFLVRNKVNVDLESERQDHPSLSEQDVTGQLRKNLLLQLQDAHVTVYLISTRLQHYSAWDFPKLVEDLIQQSPEIKRHALILSITSNSKAAVAEKVKALREHIWVIAMVSAAANVIPVPGISVACDVALLQHEITRYKKTLALDLDSLLSLVDIHGTVMDHVKKYYETLDNKNYYELIFGKELASYIIQRIGTYAVKTLAKEVLRYIPIVGQVLSSTTSFSITYMVLDDMLTDLHMAALKLFYFIESHQRST